MASGASTSSAAAAGAGGPDGASSSSAARATTRIKTSSSFGCSSVKSRAPAAPSAPFAISSSRAANTALILSRSASVNWTTPRRRRSLGAASGTIVDARAVIAAASAPARVLIASLHPALFFRFRDKGVPTARSWPLAMIAVRVQSASASSMECVVRTTALPTMALLRTVQSRRRDTGSRPAEGSSSNTTDGSPTSAHATQSLRFMPPDSRAASRSGASPSSTSSSMRATVSARCVLDIVVLLWAILRSRNRSKCSAQDSASYNVSVCVTTPKCVEARLKSSSTEWPRTSASPAVGNAALMTTLMAEVFPAPFAPSSPKISPSSTRIDKLDTATVSFGLPMLYTLRTPLSTSAASLVNARSRSALTSASRTSTNGASTRFTLKAAARSSKRYAAYRNNTNSTITIVQTAARDGYALARSDKSVEMRNISIRKAP
mmetsp:Transcript_21427/g.55949  ORF Transcript_21427/g.55949 Transcript_21427/m.55949 type:complete len:434 (+) Transcript_21427:415-1716(+)